jgi:hypothetical protein
MGDITIEHEVRKLRDQIEHDEEHKAHHGQHEREEHLSNEIPIDQHDSLV